MGTTDKIFLVTMVILITLLSKVECLKCVRCSSIMERGACLRGDIPPSNCSREQSFCIKYESFIEDGKFVVRDCAGPENSKNGCTVKIVENQEVKVCVSTCSTDGCNSAPRILSTISVFLIFVLGNILLTLDIT